MNGKTNRNIADVEELARRRRQVDQASDGYRGKDWHSEPQLRLDLSRPEPEPEDWHDWFMTLLPRKAA